METMVKRPSEVVSLSDRSDEERTNFFKLCQQQEKALKDHGYDHYWSNFKIEWGKRANGKMDWVIVCKCCLAKLSTENVSSAAKKHMISWRTCPETNEKWNKHELCLGRKKRPLTEADKEEVAHLKRTKAKVNMVFDFSQHSVAMKRFLEGFQTWILMNSASISFRSVEDPLLRDSLKAIGWHAGICRKNLSGSFLDKIFESFLQERQSYINHFKCFQIAGDSWKSKYVNAGNKLVGATLNFPTGCQLGDILLTSDDDSVSRPYLFGKMSKLIDALGSQFYIGCVFDGEMAYKRTGIDLQEKYPGSIHLTCQAHTLSLLLKDMSKIDSFADCFSTSHKMVALCNVRECRAVLKDCQKKLYGKELPIRLGLETRFGYLITEMKDLIRSKDAIKEMARNEQLQSKFNPDNTYSSTEDQRMAFSKIYSEIFWSKVTTLVERLGSIVEIIEHIEQDKPMVTQMFFVWRYLARHFELQEHPALESNLDMRLDGMATPTISRSDKEMAMRLRKRMEYANVEIFTVAFLLDLRFYKRVNLNTFMPPVKYVSGTQLGRAKIALRSLASSEKEKESISNEFEELLSHGLQIEAIEYVQSLDELTSSIQMPQEVDWRLEEESRGNFAVASLWRTIDPPKFPILSNFITRNLFSMHVTSCSCERLWSRMRQLYRPTRNRLNPNKAKKLLMITMGRDFNRNFENSANFLEGKESGSEINEDRDQDGSIQDEIPRVSLENLDWLDHADLEFNIPSELVDLVDTLDPALIEEVENGTSCHE